MALLIRHAGTSEAARYRALKIGAGVHAQNDNEYALDVENFVRDNVRLVGEPEEVLVHPLRLLQDLDKGMAAGDCDDMATLAGALLYALGIVRLRLKAICRDREGYYRHVFLEYRLADNERWRALDPTVDFPPAPEEYGDDFIVEAV